MTHTWHTLVDEACVIFFLFVMPAPIVDVGRRRQWRDSPCWLQTVAEPWSSCPTGYVYPPISIPCSFVYLYIHMHDMYYIYIYIYIYYIMYYTYMCIYV
jgi:hypothetical protein